MLTSSSWRAWYALRALGAMSFKSGWTLNQLVVGCIMRQRYGWRETIIDALAGNRNRLAVGSGLRSRFKDLTRPKLSDITN